MKKTILLIAIFIFGSIQTFADTEFTRAMSTCSPYLQDGSISYNGQIYNVKITLQKGKSGKCTYKEKIYQAVGFEELVCSFDKSQQQAIATSMNKFSETYKSELAKNKIFEAKLTSNGEVFQSYLVEPSVCKINHYTKK